MQEPDYDGDQTDQVEHSERQPPMPRGRSQKLVKQRNKSKTTKVMDKVQMYLPCNNPKYKKDQHQRKSSKVPLYKAESGGDNSFCLPPIPQNSHLEQSPQIFAASSHENTSSHPRKQKGFRSTSLHDDSLNASQFSSTQPMAAQTSQQLQF